MLRNYFNGKFDHNLYKLVSKTVHSLTPLKLSVTCQKNLQMTINSDMNIKQVSPHIPIYISSAKSCPIY